MLENSATKERIKDRLIALKNTQITNSFMREVISQSSKLDFSIEEDVLGKVAQSLLDEKDRKEFGQFYTPSQIVDWIVEKTVNDVNAKILDPACGSGSFLIKVYDRLKELSRKRYLNLSKDFIFDNIYGVDLKEVSIELSRINLWMRSTLPLRKLNNLENIKSGNSIAANPSVAGNKAFCWETEFLTVISEGGFDVVIGNPPYVTLKKSKEFDPDESIYSQIIFGATNAATLMIGRSLELLKNEGMLGFLLPKSLVRVNSYKKLRKYLLQNTEILHIYDLGRMFKKVRGEQVILILRKQSNKKHIENNIVTVHCYIDKNSDIYSQPTCRIPQSYFTKFDNFPLFEKKEIYNLIFKLKNNHKNLGFYTRGNISRGLPIDANSDIIAKSKDRKNSKVILRGDSIQKYRINYKLYVNLEKLEKYSAQVKTLRQKKIVLQNIFSSESGANATYDASGYLTLDTVTNIFVNERINPKYVLGLINSKLINFFLIYGIYSRSKLTMHADKVYMEKIPIPDATPEEERTISTLVNAIINLNAKNIDSTSSRDVKERINSNINRIDNIVYNLYHLTPNEKTLVMECLEKVLSKRSFR